MHKEFPNVPDDLVLAFSVKAINDCTGPKGLCPTLLVFGSLPQLPRASKKDHSSQLQRYRAAALARREYESIVQEERLRIANKKPSLPAANSQLQPGDMAYVYRERLRHFTGPHLVASVNGKQVGLHLGEKTGPWEFNAAQVRKARCQTSTRMTSANPPFHPMILHTEIISENDQRATLFDEAKRKELNGLLERGVFRIFLKEEAGDNPNIVPSRFVLAIKHAQRPS